MRGNNTRVKKCIVSTTKVFFKLVINIIRNIKEVWWEGAE